MAQTEQPLTNWEVSRAMLGHQQRRWRSERVRSLPGCLEPRDEWSEFRRERRREVGMKVFPSGPPGGAGSVSVACRISSSRDYSMGLTKRAGWSMASGVVKSCEGLDKRESASAREFERPVCR